MTYQRVIEINNQLKKFTKNKTDPFSDPDYYKVKEILVELKSLCAKNPDVAVPRIDDLRLLKDNDHFLTLINHVPAANLQPLKLHTLRIINYLDDFPEAKNLLEDADKFEHRDTVIGIRTAKKITRTIGTILGETLSIIIRIGEFTKIANTVPILFSLGHSLLAITPLSNFFYGGAGLVCFIQAVDQLFAKKVESNSQVLRPAEYRKSTLVIALTNFLVLGTYATVGFIGFGLFATPALGVLLSFAATALNWIGNNAIRHWQMYSEYRKLSRTAITRIGEHFPLVNKLMIKRLQKLRKDRYESSKEQMEYGLAMVAGMGCYAAAGFLVSPVMPFIHLSSLMFSAILLMTASFIPMIRDLAHKIVHKCCPCFLSHSEQNIPDLTFEPIKQQNIYRSLSLEINLKQNQDVKKASSAPANLNSLSAQPESRKSARTNFFTDPIKQDTSVTISETPPQPSTLISLPPTPLSLTRSLT